MHSSVFIVTLLTIDEKCIQPRCLSEDEWIKKNIVYINNGIFSDIRKNYIMLFSGKWLEIEVILTKETRFRKTNTALTLICGIWTGMCRVLREGTLREEEEISRGGNGIRVSWKQRMDTSSRRAEGWGGQWRRKMKKNKVWWLTESAIIKTIALCTNFKINFRKREHCRNRTDQGKCVVYSCWLSSVLPLWLDRWRASKF